MLYRSHSLTVNSFLLSDILSLTINPVSGFIDWFDVEANGGGLMDTGTCIMTIILGTL